MRKKGLGAYRSNDSSSSAPKSSRKDRMRSMSAFARGVPMSLSPCPFIAFMRRVCAFRSPGRVPWVELINLDDFESAIAVLPAKMLKMTAAPYREAVHSGCKNIHFGCIPCIPVGAYGASLGRSSGESDDYSSRGDGDERERNFLGGDPNEL